MKIIVLYIVFIAAIITCLHVEAGCDKYLNNIYRKPLKEININAIEDDVERDLFVQAISRHPDGYLIRPLDLSFTGEDEAVFFWYGSDDYGVKNNTHAVTNRKRRGF